MHCLDDLDCLRMIFLHLEAGAVQLQYTFVHAMLFLKCTEERGKDYNAGNSTIVYYTLYYGSRVQICRFINKTSQPHCQPARPLQLNLMVV